jgi:hypothetical protein
MKSSIHLFYGIIIGILICACTGQTTSETTSSTGSLKEDKAEFEVEELIVESLVDVAGELKNLPMTKWRANEKIKELKKDGWTIIDWEIGKNGNYYFHVGK